MPTLTASAWGRPGSYHYRFLHRVEAVVEGRPILHVVGCADGKFVLPAARRGWHVHAIDLDRRMISGCEADASAGVPAPVPGLQSRLAAEGLGGNVTVHTADFMTLDLPPVDALWTSGCLQYSVNSRYHIGRLTDRLRRSLRLGGLGFVEYMLPDEPKLVGRPNCPVEGWWRDEFPAAGWEVLSHVTLRDRLELGHPYLPHSHTHSWGRVLARRL